MANKAIEDMKVENMEMHDADDMTLDFEAAYYNLKERLDESEKVINTLNERLAKVIKLFNLVTDAYIQGK